MKLGGGTARTMQSLQVVAVFAVRLLQSLQVFAVRLLQVFAGCGQVFAGLCRLRSGLKVRLLQSLQSCNFPQPCVIKLRLPQPCVIKLRLPQRHATFDAGGARW